MGKLTQSEAGSFYTYLSDGCKLCQKGAKMVLFITGLCPRDCFYCPVSEERQKDLTYANERLVNSDEDILQEARHMKALGTGITGGEPLIRLEKVLHYIKLLKSEFGAEHHIHLYTSIAPDEESIKLLASAGLDEIRFHPPVDIWNELDNYNYAEAIKEAQTRGIQAGIEIPSVEGAEKVVELAKKAKCFINLNELEFSDSNSDKMNNMGYSLETEISNAVEGSIDISNHISIDNENIQMHFCSSTYKDAVQLRERLIRIADNTARIMDEITEEGTIVYAHVICENEEMASKIASYIREHGVEDAMVELSGNDIETAWWILEDLAEDIRHMAKEMYIIERYPLEDGLIVEKIPV